MQFPPCTPDADAENHPATPNSDALCSPLIYAELKALAARAMRGERECHTLQTTALVNEAWMRVVEQHGMDPANRAQYLCIAAQMMRRVLVDHARRRMASKRPSSNERIDIDEIDLPAAGLCISKVGEEGGMDAQRVTIEREIACVLQAGTASDQALTERGMQIEETAGPVSPETSIQRLGGLAHPLAAFFGQHGAGDRGKDIGRPGNFRRQ